MKVKFHLGEPFWRTAGQREIEVRGLSATLAEALQVLAQQYPLLAKDLDGREAQPLMLVNEAEAEPDTVLNDRALIHIVWPVSGG